MWGASFDALEAHRLYGERLKLEPLSDDLIAEVERRQAEALERYGARFAGPYGWAEELTKPRRPTLGGLKRLAELEHCRPAPITESGMTSGEEDPDLTAR